MEADWEIEIGGGAPIIEAHWSGFVDLGMNPKRISELSECHHLPRLAEALIKLNATDSPVWSSKTDVFEPEYIDPDEMDASADESVHAIACYVDLLLRKGHPWTTPLTAERACRQICGQLQAIELSRCRIDIVVRKASVGGVEEFGATVYSTACGPTPQDAKSRLGECLVAFTEAIASRQWR